MQKRRELRRECSFKDKLEYIEHNKLINKKTREDIRKYNTNLIELTIRENKSLKKVKQHLITGTKQMSALKDKNGNIINDRKLMTARVEEFYRALYESQNEEPIKAYSDYRIIGL